MKLDVNQLRYLGKDDFRVLQAVELGQKNHEIVPVTLVDSIAGLKHGGTVRCLKVLLRAKLVHHDNVKYDGYRLTYLGYDYLAIKAFVNRGVIAGVGRQIGVGKEADVFEVMDSEGEVMALKLHRLGRTSFRAVKSKRDYLKHRNSFSWLYLSRLAALKEYAFMAALGQHGFPVPRAIDHNRHAVLMSLVDAYPLTQVRELQNPGSVYAQCMDIMARLAAKGLIHCDFNEFNLLVDEDEKLTLIDFPQMVSVGHGNARELFYRDVECIIRFFKKKLGYIPEHDASLPYVRPDFEAIVDGIEGDLGPELSASGFEREHQLTLEEWAAQQPEASSTAEPFDSDGSEAELDAGSSNAASDTEVSEAEPGRLGSSAQSEGTHPSSVERLGEDADASAEEIEVNSDDGQHWGSGADVLDNAAADAGSRGSEGAYEGRREDQSHGRGLPGSSNRNADVSGEVEARDSQQASMGGAAGRRQALSGSAVSERVVGERRRAQQVDRLKNAARSAHKASAKKTRRRGALADF